MANARMKKGPKARKRRKKRAREQAKRCVKRYSLPVNLAKWELLEDLTQAYNHQKDAFLVSLGGLKLLGQCKRFIKIRNTLVKNGYRSRFGLQARLWKLALKDATEMLDRYWSALRVDWVDRVHRASLDKKEKHYLFKALKTYPNLHAALFYTDDVSLGLSLEHSHLKHCLRYLHQWVNATVKRSPRVKLYRSFIAEPETYRIFKNKKRQYIALTTSTPGQRVCIPLTGDGEIKGQVRIVLDQDKRRIEVHRVVNVRRQTCQGAKQGIDLGITEVFTDSDGNRWGTDFGAVLTCYSDRQKAKGQKRNRLYAIERNHREKWNRRKARKVRRNNLGKRKQKRTHRNQKQHLTQIVNQALRAFLQHKSPQKVVYEDLSRMRGKAKSRKLSRLVSSWIRAIINARLEFLVSQRGSLLKRVNPAYSSQICFACGWVHHGNRRGDRFKCLFCGHDALSDWMAALELLRRDDDPDISLWLSKEQVKEILLQRFRRRLEGWDFSFSASQVNWVSVRGVFGNEVVDDILRRHHPETGKISAHRSGQDSRHF